MTPQARIQELLSKTGIPSKEIQVYGSQVMIVCHGEASARKFASVLSSFCSRVRKPVQSYAHNKVNRNTTLRPSSHVVWLVSGVI